MPGKTAKQAQTQPEPVSDGGKEAKVKVPKAPKIRTIKLLRVPKDDEKVGGAQVKGIIKCLSDNGKTMTTEELRGALGEYITTRQDPLRVFMFYQKSLLDQGLISVAE